jgi:DNA-binding CsgD family transcriptional regulator
VGGYNSLILLLHGIIEACPLLPFKPNRQPGSLVRIVHEDVYLSSGCPTERFIFDRDLQYCTKCRTPWATSFSAVDHSKAAYTIGPMRVTEHIRVARTSPASAAHELATDRPSADAPPRLTDRETEVLRGLTEGKSNPELARELFVSVNTVKFHVANVLTKMNVRSRTEAAVLATELKLAR